MRKLALAGLSLGACLAYPAAALEHEVVIDHVSGPIAADYRGSVTIATTQVGAAGAAGRPSTLACRWTASLNVERVAKLGESLRSHKKLTTDNVAAGARPGWCETGAKAIERMVASRSDQFREAMLALVDHDRAALLAEAESMNTPDRDG